jgi:sugar phosphate isomerase/epimerase
MTSALTPCLADVTLLSTPLMESLKAAREAGFPAVEIWLTKLEEAARHQPLASLLHQAQELGLHFPAASFQGGLLLAQGQRRREQLDLFQRRLSLCQAWQIPVLILAPDVVDRVVVTDLQRALVSLKQAAQLAATFDVKLALEFHGTSRWCASLLTAQQLVAECEEPNLGLCLDLFHFYTGPSKFEDLAVLDVRLLFHVQICDVAGIPRELAGDGDRILPNEGDFQVRPLLDTLRQRGWSGPVAVELMNPALWQMQPAQVASAAWSSLKQLGLIESN